MNNQLTFIRVYSFGWAKVGKGIVESQQLFLIQRIGMEVSV